MDMMLLFGLAIGVALAGFLAVIGMIARAGGVGRALDAMALAGRAARDPALDAKLKELTGGGAVQAPTLPLPPPKPAPGEPLRLLKLLQTEARLVDFLMQDISAFDDAQVGTAVRKVHADAQASLKKYVTLAPVMPGNDGDKVTVPKGFDPASVQVVGNVTGEPPFAGELTHPGWQATAVTLPTGPAGLVLQPAEVQVG